MGVFRSTLYDWINADEELQTARNQAREATIDFAEGKLLTNIKEGKETSIIFFLKTIGQRRGYIEKTQIDHKINKDEQFDYSKLSDAELEHLDQLLSKGRISEEASQRLLSENEADV